MKLFNGSYTRVYFLFFLLFVLLFFALGGCNSGGGSSDDNTDNNTGSFMAGGQPIESAPPAESTANSAPEISDFSIIPSTINLDSQVSSATTSVSQIAFKVSFADNEGDVIKCLMNFSNQPDKYYLYDVKAITYGFKNYQLIITDTVSMATAGTYTVKIAVQDEAGNTSNYLTATLTIKSGEETKWYNDSDDDGYGDPNTSTESTSKPNGYVSNSTDCNDFDASINPGASEVCNDTKDNDCDGKTDCDDSDCSSSSYCQTCTDMDSDGYYTQSGCGSSIDCNDYDSSIHPGSSEICNDGKDNDCDGDIDCDDSECNSSQYCNNCKDMDGDGYYGQSGCGTAVDCNDNNKNINPGESEACGDGKDNDCDGQIDEGCSTQYSMNDLVGTWSGDYSTNESSGILTVVISNNYSASSLGSDLSGTATIDNYGIIEIDYTTIQTSGETEWGTMHGSMSTDKTIIYFSRIVWTDSGGESDDEPFIATLIKQSDSDSEKTLTGYWKFSFYNEAYPENGDQQVYMLFNQTGNTFTGSGLCDLEDKFVTAPSGTVDGTTISFTFRPDVGGPIFANGTIEGNTMSGTWHEEQDAHLDYGTWQAERLTNAPACAQ